MAGALRRLLLTCKQQSVLNHGLTLSRLRHGKELIKHRSLQVTLCRPCSNKYYDDDDDEDFTPGRYQSRARMPNSSTHLKSDLYEDRIDRGGRLSYDNERSYNRDRGGGGGYRNNSGKPNRFSSNRHYDSESTFGGGRRGRQDDHRSSHRDSTGIFGMNFRAGDVAELDTTELTPISRTPYKPSETNESRSLEEVSQYRKKHSLTLVGDQFPHPIVEFTDYDFPEFIQNQLMKDDIQTPTPIQAQTWPVAMDGKDFIGISQTGSGKTLAFLLPALLHIMDQPPLQPREGPMALVLAPTRELANQILSVCHRYCRAQGLRACAAYGGASRNVQLRDLDRGIEILVATPGRLNDFLQSGELNLRRTSYLVVDEADRMLDMGFAPQLRQIVKHTRPDRQTLMFSATWPQEVQQLARTFMNRQPLQMNVGSLELQANPDITQKFHVVRGSREMEEKLGEVLEELSTDKDNKILMFMQTKRDCDRMELKIRRSFNEFNVAAIHGDKAQSARENILRQFRTGRKNFLVATEVAARGIDVTDITHVINFGFPNDCEQYVHRIGRTGRSGKKGESHTIMYNIDRRQCRQLIKLLEEARQDVPAELNHFGGRY